MWALLWTTLRFPIVGSLVAFGILLAIDQLILPLHHTAASAEGILFMESAVLVLLLGGLVWDKTQAIRQNGTARRTVVSGEVLGHCAALGWQTMNSNGKS
jgi:hypothetical protein